MPVAATILDGKLVAGEIKADLTARVAALAEQGITPGLGVILVGDDPGSAAYVAGKHKDCDEVGIASFRQHMPESSSERSLTATIAELNDDEDVTAYIIQLPLPSKFDAEKHLEMMDPNKDADGLHPVNLGRLTLGAPGMLPCTPRGIVELLRRYEIPIDGAEVCVIGRGVTVGRPLGLLLNRKSENATVTLCHTGTRDMAKHVREADIVVAAAGVPGLITGEMIKPGAAVLDVGITRTDEGLRGDLDKSVFDVAGYVAPMPGGVGLMTRAMLLKNVVEVAEKQALSLPDEDDRGIYGGAL